MSWPRMRASRLIRVTNSQSTSSLYLEFEVLALVPVLAQPPSIMSEAIAAIARIFRIRPPSRKPQVSGGPLGSWCPPSPPAPAVYARRGSRMGLYGRVNYQILALIALH